MDLQPQSIQLNNWQKYSTDEYLIMDGDKTLAVKLKYDGKNYWWEHNHKQIGDKHSTLFELQEATEWA